MVEHLFRLFSAATKQQYWLQQARMTTGWYIYPFEISTTTSGMLTAKGLNSSPFLPFQKVHLWLSMTWYWYGSFTAAKKYVDDPLFQQFKKQLFHAVMSKILSSLQPGMLTPQIMKCPDWHFWHVIFSIGPYITNYPEQVLISGIVQNWCGRFVFAYCFVLYFCLWKFSADVLLSQMTSMVVAYHRLWRLLKPWLMDFRLVFFGMNGASIAMLL